MRDFTVDDQTNRYPDKPKPKPKPMITDHDDDGMDILLEEFGGGMFSAEAVKRNRRATKTNTYDPSSNGDFV